MMIVGEGYDGYGRAYQCQGRLQRRAGDEEPRYRIDLGRFFERYSHQRSAIVGVSQSERTSTSRRETRYITHASKVLEKVRTASHMGTEAFRSN